MRVNELASSNGVSADTIRFYTRKGLLRPERCPTNGYREYGPMEQSRLRFILSAKYLGFSLGDITQIFKEAERGETPYPLVRVMIEQRLDEIEQRFEDMTLLKNRMHRASQDWRNKPDGMPNGNTICHLIEVFHE